MISFFCVIGDIGTSLLHDKASICTPLSTNARVVVPDQWMLHYVSLYTFTHSVTVSKACIEKEFYFSLCDYSLNALFRIVLLLS